MQGVFCFSVAQSFSVAVLLSFTLRGSFSKHNLGRIPCRASGHPRGRYRTRVLDILEQEDIPTHRGWKGRVGVRERLAPRELSTCASLSGGPFCDWSSAESALSSGSECG